MPAITCKLLSYKSSDINRGGLATYAFEHSTDGRAGTTLRFEVDLRILPEAVEASSRVEAVIRFDGCTADSPDHAFDRLRNWLARAAEAVSMTAASSAYDVHEFGAPGMAVDVGRLPIGGRIRIEPVRQSVASFETSASPQGDHADTPTGATSPDKVRACCSARTFGECSQDSRWTLREHTCIRDEEHICHQCSCGFSWE
jgi:hypothetical protein